MDFDKADRKNTRQRRARRKVKRQADIAAGMTAADNANDATTDARHRAICHQRIAQPLAARQARAQFIFELAAVRAAHVPDQIFITALTPNLFDSQTLQITRVISGETVPDDRLQLLVGNVGGDDRQLVVDRDNQKWAITASRKT